MYLRGTAFSGGFCDEEYFDSPSAGYRFRTPGACPSKLSDSGELATIKVFNTSNLAQVNTGIPKVGQRVFGGG